MKAENYLLARVSALENITNAILSHYALEQTLPQEVVLEVYRKALDLALVRQIQSQPGPETDVAKKAMREINHWYERIQGTIT